MKYLFISDTHLGISRSHSIPDALSEKVNRVIHEALDTYAKPDYNVIHGGDLFDRHSNKEKVILQGINLAYRLNKVLAGNHDCLNIEGYVGSLEVVSEALSWESALVISEDPSKPYMETWESGPDRLYAVPHCFTQSLFEDSLKLASEHAAVATTKGAKILLLHCNVGEAFGKVESEGTTLALTRELQDQVAGVFDLVAIGHEHHPQTFTLKGCTFLVMGSHYPMAFGEVCDKFIHSYDSETRELEAHPTFVEATGFKRLSADEFMQEQQFSGVEIMEVVGEVAVEDYPALVKRFRAVVRANAGTLVMAKNSVSVKPEERVAGEKPSQTKTLSLPELVESSLRGSDLWDTYQEVKSAVTQESHS